MSHQRGTPRGRKLTPWYPQDVKPVHVGYYQASLFPIRASYNDAPCMLWTGKVWWNPYTEQLCAVQSRVWRGLARKP